MFAAQEKISQGGTVSVRTKTLPPQVQAPVPTPGRIRRDLALPPPRYLAASHSATITSGSGSGNLSSSSSSSLSPMMSATVFALTCPSDTGFRFGVPAIIESNHGYKIENDKCNNSIIAYGETETNPHNFRKFNEKEKQIRSWLLLMGLTLVSTPASGHFHYYNDDESKRHYRLAPIAVVNTPSSRLSQKLVHLPRHELDHLIVQHIRTKLCRSALPLNPHCNRNK